MQVPEQSFWFLLLMEYNSTELGQGLLPALQVTLAGCVFCPAAQCWVMQCKIGCRHTGAQRGSGRTGSPKSILPWLPPGPHQEPSSLTAPACRYAPRSTGVKAGRNTSHRPRRGDTGLFSLVCPRRAWAPTSRCAYARALSEWRESTDLGHGTHWGKSISGLHN